MNKNKVLTTIAGIDDWNNIITDKTARNAIRAALEKNQEAAITLIAKCLWVAYHSGRYGAYLAASAMIEGSADTVGATLELLIDD